MRKKGVKERPELTERKMTDTLNTRNYAQMVKIRQEASYSQQKLPVFANNAKRRKKSALVSD